MKPSLDFGRSRRTDARGAGIRSRIRNRCHHPTALKHQEALETGAVVRELADAVEHEVDDLLADGVVTTGVVVGGILLAGDELLRVEQLAVGAGADLVDDGRLEVDEHAAGHVLAGAGLGEEGVEGVVAAADGLVRGHLAVRLDAVLEAKVGTSRNWMVRLVLLSTRVDVLHPRREAAPCTCRRRRSHLEPAS